MIINTKHRFCFFAIPRTASKAIGKVLIEAYHSQHILKMHTSLEEFRAQAKPDELQYFTFCSIRNPLDSLVSSYFKIKSDHNGRFSRGTWNNGRPLGEKALEAYTYITENDANFSEYFLHFFQEEYRRPRHEATFTGVDAYIRFEHLQVDFDRIMARMNLPTTTIPVFNTTKGRQTSFSAYYTPEAIDHALTVMSPIMQDWGYEFPKEWTH